MAMTPPAGLLQELLEGNAGFVREGWEPAEAQLLAPPRKRLAVLACMDTRHNVERVLGLRHGDAKVIRNAGNWVDDGALRSLVVAVHLLGVEHIAIMGHTKCGMMAVGRGEFRVAKGIAASSDIPLHELMRPEFQRWLGGIRDAEEHVRDGVTLVRAHPYIPDEVEVMGLLYDNDSGRVRVVEPAKPL
jgi:carbonic anhydrase